MLKDWMTKRKSSALSVDPNDPTSSTTTLQPATGGLLVSAEECFIAWRSHFETDAWRAAHSTRAVSAIYFHWAGEGAIQRPAMDVQFDRLTGISSHYQYFMLREGEVLMRPYSCWCPACFSVAEAGPGCGTRLNSAYEVVGCTKSGDPFYSWRNASCRAKSGAEASSPDKRAREHGHHLAAVGLKPGQWVLVEAYGDEVDEMWLGKTVAFDGFGSGSSCCKRHSGGQKNAFGTRFNAGDYMVAVQWYERLPGDGERRQFYREEPNIYVINSTELRGVDVEVTVIGALPSVPGASDDPEAFLKWELCRDAEAEALTWCR